MSFLLKKPTNYTLKNKIKANKFSSLQFLNLLFIYSEDL